MEIAALLEISELDLTYPTDDTGYQRPRRDGHQKRQQTAGRSSKEAKEQHQGFQRGPPP